ncbi:neural proliferation differentiation and control protein 1-like isoform X2 [Lineus longissimus]|uniref:neural proliferation differentiation and control protein 1-like isoform X2 n=1 Tax=Lineus longissimus TaxID=88925 RepID=UPI002B4E4DE0
MSEDNIRVFFLVFLVCLLQICFGFALDRIDGEKFGASSDDSVIDNLALRNDLGKAPDVKADVKAPDPNAATPTATKTTNKPDGKPQHQAVQQHPGGNDAGSGVGAGAGSHAGMAAGTLALIMAGCGAAGLVGLIAAGVCWYKLEKNVKDSSEVDYPAYGVTGPQTKDRVGSPTDRKLAQSVQMYHYQHQKQQMIALEKANGEMKHDASDEDSEEENEEGDYTVYECPGLAPTGEMEVKNPLFSEEAPASPGPDKKDGGSAS